MAIGLIAPEKFNRASSSICIVSFASRNLRLVNLKESLYLSSMTTSFCPGLFKSLEIEPPDVVFESSISGIYGLFTYRLIPTMRISEPCG